MAQYQKNNQRHQAPSGPSFEQQVIEGFFKGLWWLICLLFKGMQKKAQRSRPHQVSNSTARELQQHWQQISAYRFNQQTWPLAVSEADKLVDTALKSAGFAGSTFADRLKSAERFFRPNAYQALWDAHKLRNNIAHQVGYGLSQQQVNQAMYSFEQALNILGVIV